MKLLFSILVCLCTSFALAQSTEAEFDALLKDRKTTEAEALANARIATKADDEIAILYLANLVANDSAKRAVAVTKAEACVAVAPKSSKCHQALGRLYGVTAMASGPMEMMKYASRIKEAFLLAVALDPRDFDARRDLNQFYLQAPGIAGGSVRKAISNAEDFGKINPVQGKLLRNEIHVYEKEFDEAESVLAGIKPGSDKDLAKALTQAWVSLGQAMIADKKAARAQAMFEQLIATDPSIAAFHALLGRAQLEGNLIDPAINSMERALKMDSRLNVHYRLGMAYQAKGEKAKASSAYQEFLKIVTTGKAADDARKRLASLK